jgi:hypothetical protein
VGDLFLLAAGSGGGRRGVNEADKPWIKQITPRAPPPERPKQAADNAGARSPRKGTRTETTEQRRGQS